MLEFCFFTQEGSEEALSQRTYMEMQPVVLEPLNVEVNFFNQLLLTACVLRFKFMFCLILQRPTLISTASQCSTTENPRVLVDKASCTDLNVAALLQENAQNKVRVARYRLSYILFCTGSFV